MWPITDLKQVLSMIAPRAAFLAAVATLALFVPALAKALPPTPSARTEADPARLSPFELEIYRRAFDAADHDDWEAAKGLADQGRNPLARDLVLWRYDLSPRSQANFDEINAFLKRNPNWPLRSVLYRRAEHAMPANLPPKQVIAWFGDRKPQTGIGMIRLGVALLASGEREEGRQLIRKGWIEGAFTPDEEHQVLKQCRAILTQNVQRERLNFLIWHNDVAAARRQMHRVDRKDQRIAIVRLAFQTTPAFAEHLYYRLPYAWRSNPGLVLGHARVLRARGNKSAVADALLSADLRGLVKIDPSAWWSNLALAARDAMELHRYRLAYRLAAEAGLKSGDAFAQSQFLAGWLALRFLHDPSTALRHFKLLADGVSMPISLARAYYWMGRAYEAKGELLAAVRAYHRAAAHPDTFYGQLALARLDPNADLILPRSKSDPASIGASYDGEKMTRAIHILAQLHAGRFVRIFAEHDVKLHPKPSFVARLASDLVHLGYRDAAVQAAQFASYRGIELPAFSHPVIALPRYRGPGSAPTDALVLALIRQETEFDATAVSSAGARGLMQVMPSSAQQLAAQLGVPFRPAELTQDQNYNLELGMTELAQNLRAWNGSYILAAAGYNAGDGNVRRWINFFGDPRTSAVNPIDWIEMIPFAETRNYVQRVLENTEIYRDRLTGKSEPLRILADLYRPSLPPQQRPLPSLSQALDVPVPKARPREAANITHAQTASVSADANPSAAVSTPTMRPKPDGSMQ